MYVVIINKHCSKVPGTGTATKFHLKARNQLSINLFLTRESARLRTSSFEQFELIGRYLENNSITSLQKAIGTATEL